MATKAEGVPCYDKAGDQEELFCLRAQDQTMPATIIDWIGRNMDHASDETLRNAFESALRARAHIGRRWPN